jgi:predicted phage terminase large subunit-like protein
MPGRDETVEQRAVDIALERLGIIPKKRRWRVPGDMAQQLDPRVQQTPALRKIDEALLQLADDKITRLMVFMPPQEGKSQRVSRWFPLWLLEHNKDLRIGIVSYSDEMARRWGAEVKRDAERFRGVDGTTDLGLRLREDSQAAGRWQISHREGGVYCCGVAGALTGKPVDVLIIDDPIKNREEAMSEAYRKRAWDFWTAVAVPRLAPTSKVVLIQTRWHESDLAGKILAHEAGEWTVVSMPAIAEENDALGRKAGTPLKSVRDNPVLGQRRDWNKIRRAVGEYVWAALYQQRPAPVAGGLFKRRRFRYWESLPPIGERYGAAGGRRMRLGDGDPILVDLTWRFITADLAASTKTSADWTVFSAWSITNGGDLVLLDRVRDRLEEADHWSNAKPLRERWGVDVVYVESRMFGTTFVMDATRDGIPVSELKADTDKITRALPASARVDAGRVWFPKDAEWLEEWESELVSFPNGAFDDQVDTFAYAARIVAQHWVPTSQPVPRQSAEDRVIEEAYAAAVGGMRQDPLGSEW